MNMQEIVESTRATVAERPYTTYDRGSLPYCTYLEGKCSDDSVGCLLGQVLTGLGVSPDMLFRNTGIAMFLGRDLHLVDTDDDRQAVKWCSLVQLLQDKGDRWSSAIAAAESKYPCAY